MKSLSIITAALIAVAGVASAQSVPALTSVAATTLSQLAPNADLGNLSALQISELNRAAVSDEGLTQADLYSILRN
ncbi:hypothetical protein GEU84_009160 [Fertoebacter nigrum]|uniref:Uncharacterized protein n=1 Tax=Fertoeibacter niger TaxID=2656921 RepID=A0A8X8H1J0_9RHOB|nr:hypothetical protein [Fertoeibacter niger]NUB44549.1 hypothetical protein [Fertoeibacter niger]